MLRELSMVEQRYLAVREVLDTGAGVNDVATRYGFNPRTLHRWLVRYASGGLVALADRSSKPDRCPHHISPDAEPAHIMPAVAYWLVKTEPGAFSIDHLERMGTSPWDGVRNYQARNNLMAMKVGDRAFFYHSSVEPPGIVGICEVAREAYPDPSAFDPASKYYDERSSPEKPRWFMPDVRFLEKFSRMLTLEELRQTPGLEAMALLQRGQRLSVQPVSEEEWRIITGMGTPARL